MSGRCLESALYPGRPPNNSFKPTKYRCAVLCGLTPTLGTCMYRYAFPICPVHGGTEPKPYGHLVLHGAVPEKCSTCRFLFEGSCIRAGSSVEDYQVLDHGPCPIKGDTSPVEMLGMQPARPLFVPRKCSSCEFLTSDPIRGFVCAYQKEKWGQFPRSLDWGNWEPKITPLGIEGKVIATVEVLSEIEQGHTGKAVIELKRLYPHLSTEAAMKCASIFSRKLNEGRD